MSTERLVAITCIRNEVDVVEAYVRHTLAFADHLLAIDHGSTDGTTEILQALVDEGLSLEVSRDDRVGNLQSEQMTALLRRAGALDATWVLPVDSDEFVQVRDGGPLVLPAIDEPLVLAWTTYVPVRDDDQDEPNPVRRIRHHLRAEPHQHPKLFVPGSIARRPGVVLTQGNHGVLVDGVAVAPTRHDAAHLAHFPIRDLAQHAEKTATRWMQRSARGGKGAEDFFYEVGLENRLANDWASFAETFWGAVPSYLAHEGAPDLVDDPIDYRGGALRHAAPPRTLGPVLGRTLLLADRVIRSARVEHDETPADVGVVVRAVRGDSVVDAGSRTVTTDLPATVGGSVVDGPVDAVELVVDAAEVLVDVRSVRAGDWRWTAGLGPHPVVTVADPHGALLPHIQCVRVLQPLAGPRVRVALPPGVVAGDVEVEVVVMGSAATIRRTVVDRAHATALNMHLGIETPELAALRADTFAMRQEHDALVAERDRLRDESDRWYQDCLAARAHVSEIGAALDDMRASRDGWHAEAEARGAELAAIEGTRVWRLRTRAVTSPAVRTLRGIVGRARRPR